MIVMEASSREFRVALTWWRKYFRTKRQLFETRKMNPELKKRIV